MRAGVGPFSRVQAFFAAIEAALAIPSLVDQQAAIAAVGSYRGRGHGEGLLGNKHSRHSVAMDKRAAVKARNKRKAK